jgi:hypothetical protein
LTDAKIDVAADDDHPVLHRKHRSGDAPSGSSGSGSGDSSSAGSAPADTDRPTLHKKDDSDSSANSSAGNAPASDSDRPTLHKKDTTDNSSDTSATNTSSTSASTSNGPVLHKRDTSDSSTDTGATSTNSNTASDPDRPTLHKKTSDEDSASGNAQASDPDRPTLKKGKKKQESDVASVESLPDVGDPDRPRLKRGTYDDQGIAVEPSLLGLPQDLQQTVAVSDAKNTPDHPWDYSWANPDDEAKMKSALEDMARGDLGLNPPPPPPAPKTKTGSKSAAARKKAAAAPPPPPPPAPLEDEQFRVFELAYGSGATMVLTAHTPGTLADEKFITLVAQPDLYGNIQVLLKSATDGAHLDEKPRMRLVDAVDAMADNRGELLFELRGTSERQFALYRVLRGQAEQLFVGGGAEFANESAN